MNASRSTSISDALPRVTSVALTLALSFSLALAVSADDDAELRGEALGDSPVASIADILVEPSAFTESSVIIEGVAEQVCETRG